jgi:hypothetical protein
MKITDFWNMAVYSFVDQYQHFKGSCCLRLQSRRVLSSLEAEATDSFKTLALIY